MHSSLNTKTDKNIGVTFVDRCLGSICKDSQEQKTDIQASWLKRYT